MKNLFKRFLCYIKYKYLYIKWWFEDRKHRKDHLKYIDPNIGCGLYGKGVSCYKCPRYIRCWLN